MRTISSKHIAPLSVAAGQYLQVLVDNFTLHRHERGAELIVDISGDPAAIWSRHGRRAVFKHFASELNNASAVQADIDRILFGPKPESIFSGTSFPFRYCSGGTLPIIVWQGKRYYCLFYREIHPIGWNIANGGCNSLEELLNPTLTIERELSEELLIFCKARKARYVFTNSDSALPAILSMAGASLIKRLGPVGKDLSNYRPWRSALLWPREGPDQLVVRCGSFEIPAHDRLFLTVTAHDCSIEVDRVAQIGMEDDAVIVHGEIIDYELLDSIVGLFEVEQLDKDVLDKPWGKRRLYPSIVFHSGMRFDTSQFEERLENFFLPWVKRFISDEEINEFRAAQRNETEMDLCPVTEGLVQRVARSSVRAIFEDNVDTFLSHATHPQAPLIANFLRSKLGQRVFTYEEAPPGDLYLRQICKAIEQAKTMVVFGTRARDFRTPFVEFEYIQFGTQSITRPHKTLITVAPGVHEDDLPSFLSSHQGVLNKGDLNACLAQLEAKFVRH